MANVFLSYQREDHDLARRIARALQSEGFSVWWDDSLNPVEQWDRAIEREIAAADCVLVLWTPTSVESEWVRIEANYAKGCEPPKLIQARFRGATPPMAFSLQQYADLTVTRPAQGRNWIKLTGWIREAIARAGAPSPPEPTPDLFQPSPPPPDGAPSPRAAPEPNVAASLGPRIVDGVALIALGVSLVLSFIVLALMDAAEGEAPSVVVWLYFTQFLTVAPLVGYAVWRRQIGWLAALLLVGAVALAHWLAWGTAGLIAGPQFSNPAALGGVFGGLIGAVLPFLALIVMGRGTQRRSAWIALGAGVAGLSVLGAVSFAIAFPNSTAIQTLMSLAIVYLPWQLAFGAVVLFVLAGRQRGSDRW